MCMLIGQFLFVGSLSGILQAASNQLNRLSTQQLMQTGSQLGSFVPGSKDGTGSGGQFASNGGENRIDSNQFTSQVQLSSRFNYLCFCLNFQLFLKCVWYCDFHVHMSRLTNMCECRKVSF